MKPKPASRPRRWRDVPMTELQEIWERQRAAGVCYCGCTHDALVARYGPNVRHVMGRGWRKLTAE